MKTVFLNDEFIPITQATISPLDRGFLFADAVYEVVSVFDGKPFLLDEHLTRLEQSLDAIQLPPPKTREEWRQILETLVQHNREPYQDIYLQITRGVMPERYSPLPAECRPTLFAMSMPAKPLDLDRLCQGQAVITTDDERWACCHIKTTNLLPNCLARTKAVRQGAHEALLMKEGQVCEGSNSNVFIVKDQCVKTPPTSENILVGITRNFVIDLARRHHLPVAETTLTLQDLYQADEVWITSSGRAIMPIIEVDDRPIGQKKAGPIWWQLMRDFEAAVNQHG